MDLYEMLGVERTADAVKIKKAYYAKSKVHHPDVGGDAEVFKEIVLAYSILSDEGKRKRYDNGESHESINKQSMSRDQEIMQSLVVLFVALINQSDESSTDIMKLMRINVSAKVGEFKNQILRNDAIKRKFESAAKRVKHKSGLENPFEAAARAQILATENIIKELERQLDVTEGCMAFLDAFSYEFDQQVVQIMMNQFTAGSGVYGFGFGGTSNG